MQIDLALLISCISVAFVIFQGISNMKRSQKNDDRSEATQLTTVIVKLESIGSGITEIKNEMTNLKNDIKEHTERIVKVEESLKTAHRRLEEHEANSKK